MIEILNLQKVIDQTTVLNIETLRVEPGRIEALVGPAGSGNCAGVSGCVDLFQRASPRP